jgi:hypothetical protein
MLNRKGKSMLVRLVDSKDEHEEMPPEVIVSAEDPAPAEMAPLAPEPELRPMEVVRLATKALEATVKDNGRAFLPQMSKELKRIAPDLDFKSLGKSGLREFLEEYPDLFTLHKEGRNVYVSKRKGRRPARPISELVR